MNTKSKKKNIIIIVSVFVIVFLVIAKSLGWIGNSNIEKVATEKSSLRDITEFVNASGKIRPRVEVKISPDVSGEVIELYVKEGDNVKQGAKLAKIKPDTYQANYEQILAAYNGQKANLANARARLVQSRAQLLNVESNFNRVRKMFEQALVSKTEFDNAKLNFEVAKAEVDAISQTVIAAEFNVISSKASLDEAKNNLSRTTLFAPIDGTVYSLSIEKGERVSGASQFSSGTEIMRIADLSQMEIKVSINENDIIRINPNDSVIINVDAYQNREFKGIVTQIANPVNLATAISTDQVTSYDVSIRILFESYKDLIDTTKAYKYPFRPGMSANVEIITNKKFKTLSVPVQAVTTRTNVDTTKLEQKDRASSFKEHKEYVFVYKGEKVSLRNVKTGIQDMFYIQIIEGIEEGEEVVISPFSAISRKLQDGMRVKKVDKKELLQK